MITAIKSWLFKRAVAAHSNDKYNSPKGINEGKDILLISSFDNRYIVGDYIEYLRKLGKRPKVIYYGGKIEVPDNNTYIDKEISWYGVPKSGNVEKRLADKYDMCIFLDFEVSPHYRYILSLAKAQFFIGPKVNGLKNYLDLIIDTDDKKEVELLIYMIKKNLSKLTIKA